MAERAPTGIEARIHLAPASGTIVESLRSIAVALRFANIAWLRAQLDVGKRPPRRLMLARPPWSTRPMQYVTFHGGEDSRSRARRYFDGATAMHVGEATCIELAAYDAAAMVVFEDRVAVVQLEGEWPELHAVVRTEHARFDTSTLAGLRASQQGEMAWSPRS
jgi:hypothetical protein